MWLDLRKGPFRLYALIIHCETCEYGTNLKFDHLTLLAWFYSWEKFCINRLNTLWVTTDWVWNLRKTIRPFSQIRSQLLLVFVHIYTCIYIYIYIYIYNAWTFHARIIIYFENNRWILKNSSAKKYDTCYA